MVRALLAMGIILSSVFVMWLTRSAIDDCAYVGPVQDFRELLISVNRASPGDTLVLASGVYQGNLVIRTPLRLVAASHVSLLSFSSGGCLVLGKGGGLEPESTVTVEAADPDRPAIEIRAEGVEVRGLEVRGGSEGIRVSQARGAHLVANRISGSARAGIALVGARQSVVEGNAIARSEVGIWLKDAHHNTLFANEVERATRGILLEGSRRNLLRSNRVLAAEAEGLLLQAADENGLVANRSEGSAWGLVMLDSKENWLASNRLERNARPLRVWGEVPEHFVHRIEPNNTIDGRPIAYLVGAENLRVGPRNRPAFVALVDCEDVTVEGITLAPGGDGLLLVRTRNATVRDSVVADTTYGLYLLDSEEIELVGNRIEGVEASGVALLRSRGVRVARNRILGSGDHGVLVQGSSESRLVENEIVGNRASGVHLVASREVVLEGNRVRENWVGVYLAEGGGHTVQGNVIRDGQFGIFIYRSGGNRFLDNRLENNRHDTNLAPGPTPSAPPEEPAAAAGD